MGDSTTMSTATGHSSGQSCCRFAVQVLRGRWFMMFASFLIMAGAGATYLFGVYSKEIKSTFGYDQSTLNLLSTSKDLGASIGVLSGLLAEVTPTWFVLLVGSVMNFSGYFLIWLAVTDKIAKPKVWHLCIYICIGANSQNFANTGALVTCVKNFPERRGIMLGLLKGYVGLSGAIFTQLYYAIYGNDSKSLILLIAWLPAVISLVFVYTIRTMKISTHPNELKVFYQNLYMSLFLAFLLMGLTITQKLTSFSHGAYLGSAVVVCISVFSPVGIVVNEEYATWKQKKEQAKSIPKNIVVVDEVIKPVSKSETRMEKVRESDSWFGNVFKPPKRGEDYTILQGLLNVDMLILFLATFCGLGSSLTAVDNLGQIGESLGYPTKTIGTLVSLLSIWNYLGRVFAGFVSEIILLKWKVPRPLIFAISLFISAVGDILIAFPMPGSVYVASLIIGFSYGAQLTLLFTLISELFGLKYYSTLFNCGQLACPLGSYILNVRIVGMLYDREALKQLTTKGLTREMVKELTCIGKDCFWLSFSILAALNAFGAILSFILVWRTMQYYKGDIYEKFREEMAANDKELALTQVSGKNPKL